MSFVTTAFKGGIWFATLKLASQVISWVATIIVARILISRDYGIMSMATILTGFIQMFLEMGVGTALIQRKNINDQEVSSLFWIVLFWGAALTILCFLLAYPTVAIFDEPALLSVTRAASILFIVNAAAIIPRAILVRNILFTKLGVIEASSSLLSSVAMITIALCGGGVWTLIGSVIIKDTLQLILLLWNAKWRPQAHCNYVDVKPFIGFGLFVTASSSISYINDRIDSFFGARSLGSTVFGHYSLAMNLAVAPVQKIVSLFNSIAYPVFSRLQDNKIEFNHFYLRLANLISMFMFPIFIGGIWLADDLIPLVLGSKWLPSIMPFRLLCVYQLFFSISIPNRIVHLAQSRPQWLFYFQIASTPILLLSFWISSSYRSVELLALPWVTIYLIIEAVFFFMTIKKLNINFITYLEWIIHPIIASLLMLFVLYLLHILFVRHQSVLNEFRLIRIIASISIGAVFYGGYLLFFQRDIFKSFLYMLKK